MIKHLRIHYNVLFDTNKFLKIGSLVLVTLCILATIIVQYTSIKNMKISLEKSKAENKLYVTNMQNLVTENNKLKNSIIDVKKRSLIQFTEKDLMHDIITEYPHISNSVKKEIITTILEESVKFNVNPLIIYALLHTESSMRPWIEHKETVIEVDKKKIKVKAVGLGGVVWEWWGEKLKKENIAEVRSDLFDPTVNIKATIFVYNELFKLNKHPKASNQDESAMIRYFGGGYKWYFEKIDNKIASMIRQKLYRAEVEK